MLQPTGARVGDGYEELLHPSGLPFVRLPGGEVEVGVSERARDDAQHELGLTTPPAVWERIFAEPARTVRVAPFACALHPVPDALAPADLRGRLRALGAGDRFPDVQAWDRGFGTLDEERAAELAELERDDPEGAALLLEELEVMGALVGAEPVLVRWPDAARVAGAVEGTRLLTNDEWEYVAGAGGKRAWLDDPEQRSSHPFGVSGLCFGTWTADGTPRGGAWAITPMQDRAEAISLHVAYRPGSGGLGLGVWLAGAGEGA